MLSSIFKNNMSIKIELRAFNHLIFIYIVLPHSIKIKADGKDFDA